MAPELIVCIRHGEKPVDEKGDEIEDQPGLNAAGEERASKLATALRADSPDPPRLLPPGAGEPANILVPHYDDKRLSDGRIITTEDHRSYKTVAPLAAEISLTPIAVCETEDIGTLVQTALTCEGVTLICWEHDCLVAWLQRLAGRVIVQPPPGEFLPTSWKKACFDAVWWLQRTSEDPPEYRFSKRDQALLPNDEGFAEPHAAPPEP